MAASYDILEITVKIDRLGFYNCALFIKNRDSTNTRRNTKELINMNVGSVTKGDTGIEGIMVFGLKTS